MFSSSNAKINKTARVSWLVISSDLHDWFVWTLDNYKGYVSLFEHSHFWALEPTLVLNWPIIFLWGYWKRLKNAIKGQNNTNNLTKERNPWIIIHGFFISITFIRKNFSNKKKLVRLRCKKHRFFDLVEMTHFITNWKIKKLWGRNSYKDKLLREKLTVFFIKKNV